MALLSKYTSIDVSCMNYVHPWTSSCTEASALMIPSCVKESLRIYTIAYSLALLMKGKIPSKNELIRTVFGIMQSSVFLTLHGVGFSASLCSWRRIVGSFNFLTVSFLPKFIISIITILIERPSRRGLLSLYVTNVASETMFRMAVSRKLITPLRYGEVLLFACSVSYLLYFYKGLGLPKDPVYSLLRFLVGPYEEYGYYKMELYPYPPRKSAISSKDVLTKQIYIAIRNKWNELVFKLKTLSSHPACPHSFSCLYYVLSGSLKTFSVGYGLQLALKLVMGFKRIIQNPVNLKKIMCRKENLKLGVCFASFTALYRGVSCLLRRHLGTDSDFSALPAGFIAGLAFYFYRDNTIALYFMWKTFQISYNLGVKKGFLPKIPYISIIFYAFSTAVLFHVALVEPHNLRPSYWRFLQAMSGNRLEAMNRNCLDVFGLKSSESLATVLARENRDTTIRKLKQW